MMKSLFLLLTIAATVVRAANPLANPSTAATAINSLGLDLLRPIGNPAASALISPYSIQSALAMTYAGAAGKTRDEMAMVLHFPADDGELNHSFDALRKALDEVTQRSSREALDARRYGATNDPISLTVANRLFGQTGYEFRPEFLDVVRDSFGAPLQPLDFFRDAAGATRTINGWVEDQTQKRIRQLIPNGALDPRTSLVLVNAIYLKAPWADEFPVGATKREPFHFADGKVAEVPTMNLTHAQGYGKFDGFSAVSIPYRGRELHFLILLPDTADGLTAVLEKLTPAQLGECAGLKRQEVILHLPKFKLEPPVLQLGRSLQSRGMTMAFDLPSGSADFSRMAPPRSGHSLAISEVFHKAFLQLDEKGTEAAAATAVTMMPTGIAIAPPKPVEIRVDHPFLFALQHRASGACLFFGRMADPR